MPYKFVEHTADIAVDISAISIEGLFKTSAEAWQEIILAKYKASADEQLSIEIKADSLEVLLVDFLSELNYLLLTKKWIFSTTKKITIVSNDDEMILKVLLKGENLDIQKHELKAEIKAVTYHQMKIERVGNSYRTRIVFDI
jgi:SHS2 domain-containing protein